MEPLRYECLSRFCCVNPVGRGALIPPCLTRHRCVNPVGRDAHIPPHRINGGCPEIALQFWEQL